MENLAQFLGDVSPIGPGARGAQDDCGGSELSFRPDARGGGASSRPPLGQRAEVSVFVAFAFVARAVSPPPSVAPACLLAF